VLNVPGVRAFRRKSRTSRQDLHAFLHAQSPGRYTARTPMTSASFKKLFFYNFPELADMAEIAPPPEATMVLVNKSLCSDRRTGRISRFEVVRSSTFCCLGP